jgi:hypothetical protein
VVTALMFVSPAGATCLKGAMTRPLTLKARPIKGSPGWFVQILFPDGRERRISAFATEADAHKWIQNESDDWLAGMGEGK